MTEHEQRVEVALHVLRISHGDGNGEQVVQQRIYDAANAVLLDALCGANSADLKQRLANVEAACVELEAIAEKDDGEGEYGSLPTWADGVMRAVEDVRQAASGG